MSDSFYVVCKEGNGAYYSVGDTLTLLYQVFIPCDNPSMEKCKICHEKTNKVLLEDGKIEVKVGDKQIHEYIDKIFSSGELRHGSMLYVYLAAKDAFGDVGIKGFKSDIEVKANSSLCFKLEEAAQFYR